MTGAELDDAIARFELDERIARWRQQQVEERQRRLYWSAIDAKAEEVARRKWRRFVLAGVAACSECGQLIRPESRWVVDPGWPPEHASCVVNGG